MATKRGGGGAGGGGMSEEAHEVMAQSSNFIADLCINFEEIAVRKSYVNDIPSAMCENIATTAVFPHKSSRRVPHPTNLFE